MRPRNEFRIIEQYIPLVWGQFRRFWHSGQQVVIEAYCWYTQIKGGEGVQEQRGINVKYAS